MVPSAAGRSVMDALLVPDDAGLLGSKSRHTTLRQRMAMRLFGKLQSPLTAAEASQHPWSDASSGDTEGEDSDSADTESSFYTGGSDREGRLNRFERA